MNTLKKQYKERNKSGCLVRVLIFLIIFEEKIVQIQNCHLDINLGFDWIFVLFDYCVLV